VRILRIGKRAAAYHPTTASFQALVAAAQQRVAREVVRKQAAETAWLRKNYPHVTGPAGGVMVQTIAQAPDNTPAAAGHILHLRYGGQVVRYAGDWTHYSGPAVRITKFASGPKGVPGFGDAAEFDYTVGTSKLNPALDAVLATLRPGDRRIVVVPPALGYGKNGLYPPEVAGRPRFIINPNALLVYNLEVLPE
jgi:peptidylprolyl isomerase